MKQASIMVSGAGSLFGQGIIKCLRMGHPDLELTIAGLDYFETAVGFHWCDTSALLPDFLAPDIHEDYWFDRLCEEVDRNGSQFLFIGADFELLPLARRASELHARTGCTAIVSPENVVRTCNDKYQTAIFLQEAGLPAPRSWLPDDMDLAVEDLGFPLLIKPRFGARSRGVAVIHDQEQLRTAIGETDDPVIQEYLPGDDGEFTCGVMLVDGNLDSVCALRRQLKDGNTSIAYSEPATEIESYCARVAKSLNPFGPLNIQLRLKNGQPYVFEINPRFSGTTIFRAHFGINEPMRILRQLCGLDVEEAPRPHSGRIVRYFEELVEISSPQC